MGRIRTFDTVSRIRPLGHHPVSKTLARFAVVRKYIFGYGGQDATLAGKTKLFAARDGMASSYLGANFYIYQWHHRAWGSSQGVGLPADAAGWPRRGSRRSIAARRRLASHRFIALLRAARSWLCTAMRMVPAVGSPTTVMVMRPLISGIVERSRSEKLGVRLWP